MVVKTPGNSQRKQSCAKTTYFGVLKASANHPYLSELDAILNISQNRMNRSPIR